MVYTKPERNNINFVLSSDYTTSVYNDICFNIGSTELINIFEGNVLVGTTPLSNTVVNLYKRSTGELVDSTVTTESGTFTTMWDDVDEYYFIVALHPTTDYNALIYDYLDPTVSGS